MSGALLVAGTTSDAGKSVLTAGLCRWLAREGVRVAPFKAQNMALNSMVTADGAEIGRAQAMQAAAAGVEPEAVMNPVLLKPGSDLTSQVVVLGRPIAEVGALDYRQLKPRLLETALESLAELRRRFEVVICEGAGSPAEINLRATDIANMGLARAADLPTIVVGDIDRGGVFAALYGTLALLDAEDQALIKGFVINKFRGDRRLLGPGLDQLRELTDRPVLGVLPWVNGLGLDVEDSLGLPPVGAVLGRGSEAVADTLRVAVIRLPFLSNATDLDALAIEPGVELRMVDSVSALEGADLVVIPGTRATVRDLAWLRERGLDAALLARAAAGLPILGICGGYQLLARTLRDEVESGLGTVAGLGLLPTTVTFARDKTLGRPDGVALGHPVRGYEIHHGQVTVESGEPFLDGCRAGPVWGTSWHGIMENDAFRRAFLSQIADDAGRRFVPLLDGAGQGFGDMAQRADDAGQGVSFEAARQARLDVLGDLVADHLDTGAVLRLLEAPAAASSAAGSAR